MKDHVLIATAYNNEARIYVTYTKQLVSDAAIIHETWPTATATLGRLLTAGAMISYFNKDDSSLSIKIDGDGPAKSLEVQSSVAGELRATIANPEIYLKHNDTNKLAVGHAVGNGTLSVIRNMGLKTDYRSTINLVSGEIAEDLTYYFTVSEQTPSSVGLGVLIDEDTSVKNAGGFIIQLLPNASEETIVQIEEALSKITSITDFFLEGKTTTDLLELLSNGTYKLLETKPIIYKCRCSKDYFYSAISKLDKETLQSFLEDGEGEEVICHYCKSKYHFSLEDIDNMIKNKLN